MKPLLVVFVATATLSAQTTDEFRADFDFALQRIGATYAYFDMKATKWNELERLYAPDLQQVSTRRQFVTLLERVVDELYDPHAQLTVNLPDSFRLVPAGADLWAEWQDGRAIVTQVRPGSDAERAAIRPGTAILSINGMPVEQAIGTRMGRSYPHSTPVARDWALRSVLAGPRNTRRVIDLQDGATKQSVILPAADQFTTAGPVLTASQLRPGIGYIRINDSLGNAALVPEFDRALAGFRETRGLIIDLRNTASGGNSNVARGILGRFVARELPYQKHALFSEERETGVRRSWLELVSPRGEFVYSRPVAVLVNRWTGSMGEGLAIGFDATGAATVVGTPMAGLVGATVQIKLPNTGFGINVPAERLYHVNGTPREQFTPPIVVDVSGGGSQEDVFIAAALRAVTK